MGNRSSKKKNLNNDQPKRTKQELEPSREIINRFATIPDIKAQYKIDYDDVLGSGAFGKVYGGYNSTTGLKFAVKIIDKKALSPIALKAIANEAIIVSQLQHPNVIKYYYITDNVNYLNIYMEYFSGGDLLNYVNKYQYINECNSFNIFTQLIDAVEYLHDNEIIHRDIKLDNLLFNRTQNNIRVVLTDFGLSIKRGRNDPLLTVACGSPLYVAPEMISVIVRYDGYGSDIWATGVVLYTLVVGDYPFNNDNDRLYQNIIACNPYYPERISQDCKILLQNIFTNNEKSRITIDGIRQSSWFTFWDNKKIPCPNNIHNHHNKSLSHTSSFSNLSTGKPYHNINQSYPSNPKIPSYEPLEYDPPVPDYEPPLPPHEPLDYEPPLPPHEPLDYEPLEYEPQLPPHEHVDYEHRNISRVSSYIPPPPPYAPPLPPDDGGIYDRDIRVINFEEEIDRYFNQPLVPTSAKPFRRFL